MKNKEVVSEVIQTLRALTVDDRISERYVLHKLKSFNALFLKRENEQFRLYESDIWVTVDCVELEEISAAKCADVRIPKVNVYMRTKKPISEIYSSKHLPLIKSVMTLDEGRFYTFTTYEGFRQAMSREYVDREKRYCYLRNNHLILPNSTAKSISIEAAWVNPHEAKLLSSCEDCICVDPMEQEFPCPPHLLSTVIQETVKDLFTFYKRVVVDEIPDLNTNNKTDASQGSRT